MPRTLAFSNRAVYVQWLSLLKIVKSPTGYKVYSLINEYNKTTGDMKMSINILNRVSYIFVFLKTQGHNIAWKSKYIVWLFVIFENSNIKAMCIYALIYL